MWKTINKTQIRYPVGFYEEIITVICMKMSQSDTENDKKKTKFPDFNHFYAIFIKFSIDFVDYDVENVQHGTSSLSSRLL